MHNDIIVIHNNDDVIMCYGVFWPFILLLEAQVLACNKTPVDVHFTTIAQEVASGSIPFPFWKVVFTHRFCNNQHVA